MVVAVPSNAIDLEIVYCPEMCSVPIKHLDKSVFTELTAEEKSRLENGLRFFGEDECEPCPAQHCPSVCWVQHVDTMLTQTEVVDVLHPINSRQIPEMMPYLKLEIDFPRPIYFVSVSKCVKV